MNTLPALQPRLWLSLGAVLLISGLPVARAAPGDEDITAVNSRVSRDYVRKKLPDGSYQPEGYAFGNGGHYQGSLADDTIDKLTFIDVAHTIEAPLAHQNYLPAKDPKQTRFLIMVYWGTTSVPESDATSNGYALYQSANVAAQPAGTPGSAAGAAGNSAVDGALALMDMENRQRDHLDYTNAQMLGYDSEGVIGTEYGAALKHSALKGHRHDLINEIEHNRYFVVLMAYDFQILQNQKKHKLVWETRFSINQPRNDFGKALPLMASYASRYFGQDSNGLVRKPVVNGHVEVGEPTLIELLSGPKK
jgi:hypothetical protein